MAKNRAKERCLANAFSTRN